MRKYIIVFTLFFLWTACTPIPPTSDFPEQSEYATPTKTTPSIADKSLATSTSKPTLTPTIINTPTPTISHTPSLTPEPYDKILISPDSKYLAKLDSGYDFHTEIPRIEIWDNAGTLLWTIPFQDELSNGDPHKNLNLYKWSNDSSLLYFYYSFFYDGLPTLWDGFDLQSIQIDSGEIERVLPGEDLMAFTFSPDAQFIAYTRRQDLPHRLIIQNLINGSENSINIDLKYEGRTQAGWISWSPKGDMIIFHTEEGETIQAILLDIANMRQNLLIEYWVDDYWFSGWSGNNVVFVHSNDNVVVNIDISTGITTTIGTATPEP